MRCFKMTTLQELQIKYNSALLSWQNRTPLTSVILTKQLNRIENRLKAYKNAIRTNNKCTI